MPFYVFGGPSFAFKMGGKWKSEYNGETYESTDLSKYKGMDLGIALGGGFMSPCGRNLLMLNLIITIGVLNMSKYPDYTVRNFCLALMACYLFGW